MTVGLLIAVAVITAAGCSSDRRVRASYPVASDTLVVYPFSDSPPGVPTALATVFPSFGVLRGITLPVDGSGSFDVVFDLDMDNNIQLKPARTVASPLSQAPQVGILTVTDNFDDIKSAPDVYYRPDTVTTVVPGQSVVLVVYGRRSSELCRIIANPRIFAKLVVDSVRSNTIYFRHVINPNCGYRSLTPGFPTF